MSFSLKRIADQLRAYSQVNHIRYGLPFLIAVVGGSYALSFFAQLRYDVEKATTKMTKSKALEDLVKTPKPSLDDHYEEYRERVDINTWKNVRGPRPWENDNVEYKDLIEKRLKESQDQWVFKKKK